MKKQTKPVSIVDMNDIEVLDDIAPVFARAKQDAGLALTDDELTSIIEYVAKNFPPKFIFVNSICECCKREPWYKRLWKKIKSAFKR